MSTTKHGGKSLESDPKPTVYVPRHTHAGEEIGREGCTRRTSSRYLYPGVNQHRKYQAICTSFHHDQATAVASSDNTTFPHDVCSLPQTNTSTPIPPPLFRAPLPQRQTDKHAVPKQASGILDPPKRSPQVGVFGPVVTEEIRHPFYVRRTFHLPVKHPRRAHTCMGRWDG